MSGIQIAGIVIVLFLILFLKGANKRRDERFRNLGFDGYKGFKESSEESKEQLRSDYERGISEGVLIGREFDETAFNVASELIDDRYDRLATEYLEKEPFKSLHNEEGSNGVDEPPGIIALRFSQPPLTPLACLFISSLIDIPISSSTVQGELTWPDIQKSFVPVLFSFPKLENQEEPFFKISGTTDTVSTFETVVGHPYRPTLAGNGGFSLGCPFFPSRLSNNADSSPQI